MRQAFIQSLLEEAEKNQKIMLLTGDLGFRVLEPFVEKLPDQFLNVGVSEANLITTAAGLAAAGYIPVVYSIATFMTMRPFEFIRDDVAFQKLNVKIIGVGGGLAYGPAGATHHSIEDIALMRMLPGMTVISPSGMNEAGSATRAMLSHDGPVYLRIERNPSKDLSVPGVFRIGKGRIVHEGAEVALLATGVELETAVRVRRRLARRGVDASVVLFPTIHPLDTRLVKKLAKTHRLLATIEQHCVDGGFGSSVLEYVSTLDINPKPVICRCGLSKSYKYGSYSYDTLRKKYRLTPEHITRQIQKIMKHTTL